jgi:predicted nucleotidyltransferase
MQSCPVDQRRKLLESELSRIVEVLCKDYGPEKIVLFGSMAEGKIHEWSDIDLLIIKDTPSRPIDRILEISRLVEPRAGIDLFVYTPKEMEVLLEEQYAFFTRIVAKGRVLYEKRDQGVVRLLNRSCRPRTISLKGHCTEWSVITRSRLWRRA